jgi:hypothetical protein
METPRPVALRVPSIVLMSVLVLLGLVMLPVFALLLMAVFARLSRGGISNELLGITLSVLVGFPFAVVLWFRSRRANTVRGAWILAVLGVLVLGAVSYEPVSVVGASFYDEWKETQPGGRGYSG